MRRRVDHPLWEKAQVTVVAKIARARVPLVALRELRAGDVLVVSEALDGRGWLEVDGKPSGHGRVVERSGRLGFRLDELAGEAHRHGG